MLVLGAGKIERKVTSKGDLLWLAIEKQRGYKKINAQVKQSLEKLILFFKHHI